MQGLQDFLQSASNEAAGTVSMPVDAIAWLLQKAGLPVSKPVGGSDWMAERGLTKPVQQNAASLAGQTAGLLSPMVAAAKAPQIARGLLQAGENLAAPTARGMVAGQRGAIVYHGSPHKFDKFDSSKIGTGEGAQAYGHGLYLAEAPEVSRQYMTGGGALQKSVTTPNVMIDGKWAQTMPRSSVESQAATVFANDLFGTTVPQKVAKLRAANMDGVADYLEKNASKFQLSEGSLYKVDLPDEKIARMLDWDKPISDVQRKPISEAAMKDFGSGVSGTSGEHLYKEIVFEFKNAGHPNPAQAATEWLRKNGAPGIRYLDGGSRGAGKGTSNYVVFPGEEDALKILERNGQALGLLGK